MIAVTLYDWRQKYIAQHTQPFNSRYFEEQGISYNVGTNSLDDARPTAWSKLLAVRRLLLNNEWVLWVDNDLIITDSNWDIRKYCANDMAISYESKDTEVINTGFWLFRSCQWTFDFIDELWDQDCIHHNLWEQEAFNRIYKKHLDHINLIPKLEVQCSLFDWKPGIPICHFLGTQKKYIKDFVKHDPFLSWEELKVVL